MKRIYSDVATLECTPQGIKVIDMVENLGLKELEEMIGVPVH